MRKVLLVDDEIVISKGLRAILERSDTSFKEIEECLNGMEALDKLKRERFDLLIVDIKMPYMDGIELIKEMQKMEFIPRIIILSGYSEFNYAQTAIKYGVKEYLLKPVNRFELIESLNKIEWEISMEEKSGNNKIDNIINQFYDNELNYILINRNLAKEDIQKILKTIKLDIFETDFYIAVLLNSLKIDCITERNSNPLIKKYVDEYLAETLSPTISFFDNSNSLVLVIKREIDFEDLIKHVNEKYGSEYLCGVSNMGRAVEDIRTTYLQALEAAKYRFLISLQNVFYFRQVGDKSKNFDIPLDLIEKVSEIIGTGHMNEIDNALYKVFDYKSLNSYHLSYLERIAKSFNNIFERYIKYFPQEANVLYEEYEHIKDIYNFNNLQEYILSLRNLILKIDEYIFSLKSEFKDKNAIDAAIFWIKKNYHRNDINMSIVANRVSLNYYYFSYSFKAHTGLNFVDYLKKVRIEKAKELLKNSVLKIYEVAEKVGFENPKLFRKVFKEEVGISPLEYYKKKI